MASFPVSGSAQVRQLHSVIPLNGLLSDAHTHSSLSMTRGSIGASHVLRLFSSSETRLNWDSFNMLLEMGVETFQNQTQGLCVTPLSSHCLIEFTLFACVLLSDPAARVHASIVRLVDSVATYHRGAIISQLTQANNPSPCPLPST